jgi:hypothetical protein
MPVTPAGYTASMRDFGRASSIDPQRGQQQPSGSIK